MGLGTLPLNVGGLLLIVFGLVLFGLELTVTSHGLLGVGGLVCLALGASALFTGPIDPFEPVVRVAPSVIVVAVVTFGAILALIVFGALRSRRIGLGAPIGGTCRARDDRPGPLAARARSAPSSPAARNGPRGPPMGGRSSAARPFGSIKVEGLTLTVEPDASSSTGT